MLSNNENIKSLGDSNNKAGISESRDIVAKLFPLSSSDTLNAILNQDDPGRFIRSMTRVDLFWLIKKIGEEDAFPVIRLASDDQWHVPDVRLRRHASDGRNDADCPPMVGAW